MELNHEGLGVLGLERQGLGALLGATELVQQLVILPAVGQKRLAQLQTSQCCEDHQDEALFSGSPFPAYLHQREIVRRSPKAARMGRSGNRNKHLLSIMSQKAAARNGNMSARPT